jgi:hypothetical protein
MAIGTTRSRLGNRGIDFFIYGRTLSAEHHSLREGGDGRPTGEGVIPEGLVLRVPKSEFEGDAAENERSSITRMGKYAAGMMIAKASGNAAKSPRPPRTNQVSLPSQIGAIVFMILLREDASGARPNSMPTPRSKPSEHNIEEHRHPGDQGPNRYEVENLAHRISPSARPSAPASTGACGRPPSVGEASCSERPGPSRTMRSIRERPHG